MTQGLIFDIRRYSVHDGPGIRTTVFLKGCLLRCNWCHNPEGLIFEHQSILRTRNIDGKKSICKEKAGQWYAPAALIEEVKKDMLFFEESQGGITFSGGEPLMQPAFLKELLILCREYRIHTAIDTAGITDMQTFIDLASHTDLLLYDIKCVDNSLHERHTGLGNEQILTNLQSLESLYQGKSLMPEVIIRVPFVPGFNDTEKEMGAIGKFISRLMFPLTMVELLPYHKLGRHKYEALGLPAPDPRQPSGISVNMEETRVIFKQHGITLKIST